jgi:hypothetical protein
MIGLGKLPDRAAPPKIEPSKDGDPSDAWVRRIMEIPRPISTPHILRARGQEVGTVVFQVLSAQELLSSLVTAHQQTTSIIGDDAKGSVAYEEVYADQKALALIQLAVRQPDSPVFPVFPTVKSVRDNLTDDEAGVLLAAYNIFRRESGPILSEIGDGEMDAWIAVLREGKSRIVLSRLTSEALTDIVMYAVSKIPISVDAQHEEHAAAEEHRAGGAVAPDVSAPTPDQ